MMYTESEACIYPPDILLGMAQAGYAFERDGKKWEPEKVKTRDAKRTDDKNEQLALF